MIKLKPFANESIKKLIKRNNVISNYKSLSVAVKKTYQEQFISDFQRLITKVGLIIYSVEDTNKTRRLSYCKSAIEYLTMDVLDSPMMKNTFEFLEINKLGNSSKHSIEENKIIINDAVMAFNSLLDEIAKRYKLANINMLNIKPRAKQKRHFIKSKEYKVNTNNYTKTPNLRGIAMSSKAHKKQESDENYITYYKRMYRIN